MNILITGSAGFIGFHISKFLLDNTNHKIFSIDSITDYYEVSLKKNRLKILKEYKNFKFFKFDLKNCNKVINNFKKHRYDIVLHLAAQAGVRYSIKDPRSYLNNNIIAFFNILDTSRQFRIKHFLFASSSSVYGKNNKFPSQENFSTSQPLSFYAATKKSNEVMAYSYSNIYKIPCTALRFFTVYGPYGRPDMSLFIFTKAIASNKTIKLYNKSRHSRDFTYIDDVCSSLSRLIMKIPKDEVPFSVYNLGSGKSKTLSQFVNIIEKNVGNKSKVKLLNMQKGDVVKTHSSIKKLKRVIGYSPKHSIDKGVSKFVTWFKSYYK